MTPTLEYIDSDVINYSTNGDRDSVYDDAIRYKEINKKSVWNFLDKSMQLQALVIDYLSVKLDQLCPTDVDVVKWVANAVSRCLVGLKFQLDWSADPTSLPNSLYSCESLVKLTLCHKILVDVPSPACLPSLRELNLICVVYKHEDSFVRFLSSCPVLKCLNVNRKAIDNVKKFTIKVPSLLKLEYSDCVVRDALVIHTPRLEDFRINDYFGYHRSIENMPFLKCAIIIVRSYTNYEKFLSSVSSVSSLILLFSHEMLVCSSTIKFSRLLKLRILCCPRKFDWLEPLISFLENCPKLKELRIHSDWGLDKDHVALSWNQPISTPGCLSSQLETFMWKEYGGTEGEEQFLRFILANSTCLNTAIISPQDTLTEKYLMMKEKLKDIPRASTTSQLLFENIWFI